LVLAQEICKLLVVPARSAQFNKKGVDIVVVRQAGDAVTVEVKGVAKRYDRPANNLVTKTHSGISLFS